MSRKGAQSPRRGARTSSAPGDWMGEAAPGRKIPAAAEVTFRLPDVDGDIYAELENPKTSALDEVMKQVQEGNGVIDDAVLFCGRFSQDGALLRENKRGAKPYKLLRTRNPGEFKEALAHAAGAWKQLEKVQEATRKKGKKAREAWPFQSSSDIGSTYEQDPNQFTEYTPYFGGPWAKQQYFDYFKGHARAYQEYTHHPIGKRLVDILVQYAFGRGFKILCKNEDYADDWAEFNRTNRITHKIRKYWMREYLIYGENFIDKLRWISVDPSTIYDIICEGFGEYIDKVLYYQQMFQTATQMYAGINVPGVKGSKDSKIGHYIIRQIPYDQIIHIKANVVSVEKRGRSVLYPILGWLKRLTDTLNAQVLGEQLRASFVWDDTVDGNQADVDAHGAKYNYIPVAPSLFVHNKAVERKPLTPMAGINVSQSSIVQEILSMCATCIGLSKDQLNVMSSSGGSRATAVVGSEPFTKVIEDLQEDGSDLIHQIIEAFCQQNSIDYAEEDWQVIFPAVQKDAILDRINAILLLKETGYFDDPRLAAMLAAEMEMDGYDYDEETKNLAARALKKMAAGMPGAPKAPPAGRFGGKKPAAQDDNPIHGAGKKKIVAQHKNL